MDDFMIPEEEFEDPNQFFLVTLYELRNEINSLLYDTMNCKNDEVKAFAKNKYHEYRKRYFYLLKSDLELRKLYENEEQKDKEL